MCPPKTPSHWGTTSEAHPPETPSHWGNTSTRARPPETPHPLGYHLCRSLPTGGSHTGIQMLPPRPALGWRGHTARRDEGSTGQPPPARGLRRMGPQCPGASVTFIGVPFPPQQKLRPQAKGGHRHSCGLVGVQDGVRGQERPRDTVTHLEPCQQPGCPGQAQDLTTTASRFNELGVQETRFHDSPEHTGGHPLRTAWALGSIMVTRLPTSTAQARGDGGGQGC